MSPSRVLAALPALAVLLLARLWLAPVSAPTFASVPAAKTGADRTAPACGVHDCGCPHGELVSSCCCAREAERAVSVPSVRPRAEPVPGAALGNARSARTERGPALVASHCSGGRPRSATARTPATPALALWREDGPVGAAASAWIEDHEVGPPRGLRREPELPPPRAGRA